MCLPMGRDFSLPHCAHVTQICTASDLATARAACSGQRDRALLHEMQSKLRKTGASTHEWSGAAVTLPTARAIRINLRQRAGKVNRALLDHDPGGAKTLLADQREQDRRVMRVQTHAA